jgi:anti-sigma regulatory factor (Ser/Thr protein kinase)
MGTHQNEILETELPPTVAAPSIARRLVRAAGSDLSPRSLDDAQLLVSELVSNVLAYAGEPRPIQLRVRAHRMLSLEVEDASEAVEPSRTDRDPARRPHASLWGRDLVATLADAWGVSARDGRSSAWVELRSDR